MQLRESILNPFFHILGILILQLLPIINSISAQSVNLFGGISFNNLIGYEKNEGHFQSEYEPGAGWTVGIGLFNLEKVTRLPTVRVSLENYHAGFTIYSGSLATTILSEAKVNTYSLNIEPYLISLPISPKIRLNAGARFGVLLLEKNQGLSQSIAGHPTNLIDFANTRISRRIQTGFNILLTGKIETKEEIYHAINLYVNYGLTSEFTLFNIHSLSCRIEYAFYPDQISKDP